MMGKELATKELADCRGEGLSTVELIHAACHTGYIEEYLAHYFGERQATVVIWQFSRIIWGRWQDGRLMLSSGETGADDCLQLRAFDETSELLLRVERGVIDGRWRCDGEGEPVRYVDTFSRLWGAQEGSCDGFIHLADHQRKLNLVIPYDGEPDPRGYYGLTQRNYIEADGATGLAGYGDMRYVALSGASIGTEGK